MKKNSKENKVINSITNKSIQDMSWDEIKANLGPKMTRDEVFTMLNFKKKSN